MTTVFHAWPYGRFIEIQSNLTRKKIHRSNQCFNFLGGSFNKRDNIRAPIQIWKENHRAATDLLKPLATLSYTIVRPKTMLEMRKRTYFSWWSTILLFTSLSKTLLTSQRRITGWPILAVNIYPTFFNTGTTNKTFQQSIKQDPLRHLMKSSTSMHESSRSQFFRSSSGIQSGPDAFHESSSTILEVIHLYSWILCSFRLDLEGKIDNEIPVSSRLEFLEEFLAKNFVNNNRSNTSGPLNRGGIADSPLLRTLLAIRQKS